MAKVFKIKGRNGRKSGCYYGKIKIANQWKRVPLFSDKQASERRLRELQSEQDQRAAGVRTTATDSALRPISDHVREYIASLKLKTSSLEHLEISEGVMDRLVAATGWKFVRDMSVESVENVLATLAKTESYRNVYIKRAKAFGQWLEDQGRVALHPLRKLSRVSEKNATRTRGRRSATREESAALFALALPEERRLAYAFAKFNGLRRNEVKSLTWDMVHLDHVIPSIELKQKNGTTGDLDSIPLHPYVVKLLSSRIQGMPGVNILRSVPDVKTVKKDWTRAKVDFKDAKGKRLDYHSFRHTFVTELDRTGCSRATKKRLMRHAAEDVTDGYTHADLREMHAALCQIPSPQVGVLKTGTDDQNVTEMAAKEAPSVGPQVGPRMGHSGTIIGSHSQAKAEAGGLIVNGWKLHLIPEMPGKCSVFPPLPMNDLIESSSSTNVLSKWPDTQVD